MENKKVKHIEVNGITYDVPTELDFEGVFDQEQADELNQYYKDGIEYAKEVKSELDGKATNISWKFISSKQLLYFPCDVDLTNITGAVGLFQSAFNLLELPPIYLPKVKDVARFVYATFIDKLDLNAPSATNLLELAYLCRKLKNINLHNVSNCTDFTNAFVECNWLINVRFEGWKNSNISLYYSPSLTPDSINYIIEHALGVDEGATARTLTLNATAKANWQASEQYEYYQAMATEKLITIA